MRLSYVVLVIADISGYTDFITNREISLLHAEQIITELLESLVDRTQHPLVLNKFEGDAALLYSEAGEDRAAAVRDVLGQVGAFFGAFTQQLETIKQARSHCNCDACANVSRLCLKAFVHCGEIAIKQVRHFEELAGEEVILVHRLLKNHVPEREYVLLSGAVTALWPAPAGGRGHNEEFEGLGELPLTILPPSAMPALSA